MKKMENSKKHVLFRQKSKKLAKKQLKQKKTKKRNNFTEKLDSNIKEKKSGSILTKSNNGGDKKKLRLLQKAGELRNIEQEKSKKEQEKSKKEQEKSKKEKLKNLLSHDLDHLLTEKNSLRAKISERSKIIHKILKNYPRQTAIIHKISEFFFIIFLNREIFSRYFIEKIDEKNNKATQNISYTKFLSKESIFSKLFNYLDPVNFTRILDQRIFFSFIYAYICLGLFINLIFWKKEILNKILLRSKKKKINSNGGLFIKFLSNLLSVYRLIFFVINMIFLNSFSCHQITVRKIIKPGDIYFDVMVDQNTDVEYLNGAFTAVASDEIKILNVEQISPYVNNGVVCGTTKYNFLIFFSVVIILLNFSLFLISWMISRSKPRISIRQSTKGIFDFVFQIGLNVLLFLKIFIKMKELGVEIIQDYYLYSSLTMIVMYCWALFSKPYYSRHFRGYQNFKMIYFGLISALSFIHLKFENFFFAGEKSMIILFLISLSILERLDRNLRSVDLKKICIEVKDNHQVKETTILYLYYKITKFISLKIKEFDKEKSNSKEIEKLLFLIISLKDIHKKSCRYTSCFCKRDHLFNENNSLMLSKKLQNKENFLLEAVMLLNELFEKYFRINIRQPKNEIFLCYVDFLINIFGKPSLAYKVILDQRRKNLRNSTKNRNKQYVETYLGVSLLDLDELMVENLSNGTMAFRIYNNYFNNEKDFDLQEEEEKFRFLDSILFLDQLEIMKKDIRNALWLKNDFVKEMERPSIQLSKICEISQKFCLMKESSKHKFFELKKIAGNNYSPIYCIYANFMIDICEDRKEGAKALMRYERISRNTNINKVLKIKKLLDNECVVMKVEFDEKIQRFVYITSNFQKVLGWRMEEVLGEDIEMIIPSPIKQVHDQFFNFDKTRVGGKILMLNIKKGVAVVNKEGFIIEGNLNLRMNINASNSFQIVAVFNYPFNTQQLCVAILNRSGRVKAVSESAGRIFEAGKLLEEYNGQFKEVIEDMNFISDKIIKDISYSAEEFSELAQDESWMKRWYNYNIWGKFREVNIIDKKGEIRKVQAKISNYYLYEYDFYCRFFIIKRCENREFNNFTLLKNDTIKVEEKIMRNFVDYLEKKNLSQGFEEMDKEFITRRLNERKKEEEKNNLGNLLTRPLAKNARAMEVNQGMFPFKKSSSNFLKTNKKIDENLDQLGKGNDSKRSHESQNDSMEVDFSHGRTKKAKEKKKAIRLDIKGSESTYFSNYSRTSLVERIIHSKIKPGKIHKITILSLIALILIISLNCYFFFAKVPVFELVNSEIDDNIQTSDFFAWVVWGHVQAMLMTDIARATREKWFDNDISNELRMGETLFEYTHYQKSLSGNFQLVPEISVDKKMRSMKLKQLVEYDRWIFNKIELEIISPITKSEPDIEWKKIELPRKAATQMVQGYADYFKDRDYENATEKEIPVFGHPKNRLMDIDEEVYRRFLLGDLNKQYTLRSYEVYDYQKRLIWYYQWYSNLYLYCAIGGSSLVFSMLLCHLLSRVRDIKTYYYRLFDFRVVDLKNFSLKYKKLKLKMEYILLEENIYEEEKFKIMDQKFEAANKIKSKENKKGRHKKTKISLEKYNFGLVRAICILCLLTFAILALNLGLHLYTKISADRVQNFVKIYLLGIEAWNALISLHCYFLEVVLWNNTVPTWGGQSTLDTYNYFFEHIDKNVIPNYTLALDYDLGNFTEKYTYALTKSNSCETIFNFGNDMTKMCHLYCDGLFTGNLINSLKGMMITLDMLIDQWKDKREDWEAVKGIFTQPRFVYIISTAQQLLYNFYYWSSVDIVAFMRLHKQYHLNLLADTELIFGAASFLFLMFGIFYVVRMVQDVMVKVYSSVLIMPIYLIKKNKVMIQRLQKIRKGEIEGLI